MGRFPLEVWFPQIASKKVAIQVRYRNSIWRSSFRCGVVHGKIIARD